jgi:hypothetical protein
MPCWVLMSSPPAPSCVCVPLPPPPRPPPHLLHSDMDWTTPSASSCPAGSVLRRFVPGHSHQYCTPSMAGRASPPLLLPFFFRPVCA